MTGPKEDRYRLLRATGVNTSPIVALYEDRSGESRTVLDAATAVAPSIDVVDDDGVEHRLWVVTDTGEADGASRALARVARAPAPWSSPMATTATRRRCATATSGG